MINLNNIITVKAKVDDITNTLFGYAESAIIYSNPNLCYNIPGKIVVLEDGFNDTIEYQISNNEFRIEKNIKCYYHRLYFNIKCINDYHRVYVEMNKDNFEQVIADFMNGNPVYVHKEHSDRMMKCRFIKEK